MSLLYRLSTFRIRIGRACVMLQLHWRSVYMKSTTFTFQIERFIDPMPIYTVKCCSQFYIRSDGMAKNRRKDEVDALNARHLSSISFAYLRFCMSAFKRVSATIFFIDNIEPMHLTRTTAELRKKTWITHEVIYFPFFGNFDNGCRSNSSGAGVFVSFRFALPHDLIEHE